MLDDGALWNNGFDVQRPPRQLAGFTDHHVLQIDREHVLRRIGFDLRLVGLLRLKAVTGVFEHGGRVPLRGTSGRRCWIEQAKLAVCTLFPRFLDTTLASQDVLVLLGCRLPAFDPD
ncbi:hypothetical protein D3C84_979470 [compost metagenome]